MSDATHREVKHPEITCRELADYMAGSRIKQRSIVQLAKYKPIMRLRQYKDANRILTNSLSVPKSKKDEFVAEIERLAAKLCDNEHELKERDMNVDYLRHVLNFYDDIDVTAAHAERAPKIPDIDVNGTRLKLRAHLLTRDVGRRNVTRYGVMTLRYSKGRTLNEDAALYHAAINLGRLRSSPIDQDAEPFGKLCTVFDGHSNSIYEAPGNAVTRFKNALVACEAIAQQWPNVPPPENAIIR